MRGVGIVLILLGCSGIGFFYGMQVKRGYQNTLELIRFLVELRGEINTCKTSLPQAFLYLENRTEGDLHKFLQTLNERMQKEDMSLPEIPLVWEETFKEQKKEIVLPENVASVCLEFGQRMGALQLETQLASIDFTLQQLEEAKEELRGEKQNKIRLSQLLGVLTGMFLVIVIW